ncbi:transporter substrate-binding domain-containing protein [Burkholderia sp. 1B3(2022)]|uniref:transporter substrate-binding domain-containing protein n=1 Tax=Burkholderia sp. 1B3(2022) TaxID=2997425 RepID=UPI003FA60FF2
MRVGVEQFRRADSGAAGAQVRRDPVVDGRDRAAAPADRLHRSPVPQPDAIDRAHRVGAAAGRGEARRQARRGRTGHDPGNLRAREVGGREGRGRAVPELRPGVCGSRHRARRRRADGCRARPARVPRDTARQGLLVRGGVVYDAKIMGNGDAAGVRKADTDLRDALNRAIAQIRSDGTYNQIQSKYFDFDMYGN